MNMLFLFVLSVVVLTVEFAPQIIVLNGAITTNQQSCTRNETILNFTMCAVLCARIEYCQFCFMRNECYMCQEGVVSSDTDKWRIGMKVSATTTPLKSCPDNIPWSLYRNTWCIVTSIYGDPGFTYSDALIQCRGLESSQKMYISGLEYREMLIHLRVVARNQLKNLNNASFAMWIDGYQTKPCTENCFPGSFTFTDPHLQNYTSYEWYSKGNHVEYGGVGTCLQLMFPSNTSDPRFGKVSYAECNVAQDKEFMRRAVVCGTPAV